MFCYSVILPLKIGLWKIKGAVLILILFIFYISIKLLIDIIFSQGLTIRLATILNDFFPISIFRNVYFFVLSTFYWAATNLNFYRSSALFAEKKKLEAENAKVALEMRLLASRNAYLKQQINPHILFNTLNFIYNAVYQYSESAGRSVLLLSSIMRFVLEDVDAAGKIPLEKELDHLRHLIEINEIRF